MIIVEQNNSFRVQEKDGLLVQFFDKKRQITDENLETIDIKDEKGNQIYDLYVEIYNRDDQFSVVCKNVAKNKFITITKAGVKKHIDYKDLYKTAFNVYEKRKKGKDIAVDDKDLEIAELKKQLENIQNQNKEPLKLNKKGKKEIDNEIETELE